VAESSVAGLCRVEEVMGIPVGIDVRDPWVDPDALDRAFAWLRWADATFSTYRPDSAISRLNAGTLALRDAAPEVRHVLERCEGLRARTGGCFDVRACGAIDPSAFVKGWARRGSGVDAHRRRRAEPLRPRRRRRARVRRARARPAMRRHPASSPRATAPPPCSARATWRWPPRAPTSAERTSSTRAPARRRRGCSVTVLGPDLGTADAYATAAFAMGVEGPAWTAGLGDYEALTILSDGRVLSTRGVPDVE
jgi:thiamine biosynthesis lipoprotein